VAVSAGGGAAVLLAVAFLLAPPMGTDLSAQVARANFVDRYGVTPIDLGWYGGINQFGYSMFTAALGATFGVRLVGAVAAIGSALAFGWLLVRAGARRPLLGALLGAVVLVGNLVSGRITFAVGLLLGLLALCAVATATATGAAEGVADGASWARRADPWIRLAVAGVLAALATWASPVAGLFTGLAGGALLLANLRRPGGWYRAGALVLCLASALALAPMALLFGNGGTQPFTVESMRTNLVLAVVVLLAVPGRYRAIRVGAVLTALLLVGAYLVASPIGSNALRLPMLFALPVLAAFAELKWRWLVPLLVVAVWWQNPVMVSDLTRMGSVESSAVFYRPLVDELARRAPIGRVEVVPLRDHWEASYVAPAVPLARGWERQVDVDRNPLFYRDDSDNRDNRDGLNPIEYGDWLRGNAVSYVAIAPDSPPDRYAREEAALVTAGTPELREVWRDATWRLYAVTDSAPLVASPGQLVDSTPAAVTFTADAPGDVLVRVRWSRWLTVAGPDACLAAGPDGWTTARVSAPGRYRLTSALRPAPPC
jgi:hypothetical protein